MVEGRDSWVAFLNQLKTDGMEVTRTNLERDDLPCGDVRGAASALRFWLTRPYESQTVQKDGALYYGMCLVELAGACHAAGQNQEGNMPLLNEAVRVLYEAADYIRAQAEAHEQVYTLDVLMEGRKLAAVGNHVVRFARHYKALRLETQGLHIQLNGVLVVDSHRRELVGPAMTELADAFEREGFTDQAAAYYEAVFADFADFVRNFTLRGDGTAVDDQIIMKSLLTAYDRLQKLKPDTDKIDVELHAELASRLTNYNQ